MEQETKGDLTINGAGSAGGGNYGRVTVNGQASITGDLQCEQLTVSGSANLTGQVVAGTATINGATTFQGQLTVDQFKINGHASVNNPKDPGGRFRGGDTEVNGHLSVQGDMGFKTFRIDGKSSVGGNLAGENLILRGELTVGGDCEAERFESKGGFAIAGLLNAGVVEIVSYGGCRAREIGGESITVRKAEPSFLAKLFALAGSPKVLRTEAIEGDLVQLENTHAKTVRGKNVTIGSGCEIGRVEYSGSYQCSDDAMVGEAVQLQPEPSVGG